MSESGFQVLTKSIMLSETIIEERKSIARDILDEAEGKLDNLSSYFELYDSLTRPRAQHTVIQLHEPFLKTHYEIQRVVKEIKANPQCTREELENRIRSLAKPRTLPACEIEYAINTVIHLMLMIDCTTVDRHSDGYEINGYKPTKWKSQEKLSDFVFQAFAVDDTYHRSKIVEAQRNCNVMKGWKLKKRAHVTFQPTDDLREHLLYDPQGNIVRLFRHTAFLKAHLRKSAKLSVDCCVTDCLEM